MFWFVSDFKRKRKENYSCGIIASLENSLFDLFLVSDSINAYQKWCDVFFFASDPIVIVKYLG